MNIKKYTSRLTGFAKKYMVSVKNMQSIPLTIAGIGFIDWAAFFIATGVGLFAIGISLIVIEYLIADE